MNELFEGIFARFQSADGSKVRAQLGKRGDFPGIYFGQLAPQDAPVPLILYFNPSDGRTSISMPRRKSTTLETVPVQFSIFASDSTTVMKIAGDLKDLFDEWTGSIPSGRLISATRKGPGRVMGDPDKGTNGYVEYEFTYCIEA